MRNSSEKSRETIITGQRTGEKLTLAQQMRRRPTAAEAKLWQHLRAGRLEGLHFRRQQVIDGFVADFYCHAAGLVIEADGAAHEGRADYDTERDRVLAERNLRILRFTNSEVETNCPKVLQQIADAAKTRPPAPLS